MDSISDDGAPVNPDPKSLPRHLRFPSQHGPLRAAWTKARRAKFIEQGMCSNCGKQPPPEGKRWCVTCSQKLSGRRKKVRQEHFANGICTVCTRPASPGGALCKMHREYCRQQGIKALGMGLCYCCKKRPAEMGRSFCHSCVLYSRKARKSHRQRLRHWAIMAYGGYRCNCCGEDRPEFLELDHVNNDGKKHREETGGGGYITCAWLRRHNYPKGLMQVLCSNCNHAKGVYGECPHKAKRRLERGREQ